MWTKSVNPSLTEAGICLSNLVTTIAADALTPCVIRSLAAFLNRIKVFDYNQIVQKCSNETEVTGFDEVWIGISLFIRN